MPELPEVQTVVDDLNRKIRNAEILDFWTDWTKAINISADEFRRAIVGKKIKKISRRAKNILIHLDDDKIILIHLKMTGHLLLKDRGKEKEGYFSDRVNQFIHHIWHLRKNEANDGFDCTLEFSDMRKFGKIFYGTKEQVFRERGLEKLGIDPLSDEFDLKKFKEVIFQKPNWMIRQVLLEQSLIAGIGNIYVSEILFEAGVDPERKVENLGEDEVRQIHEATIRILKKAIELRGTSDSDYRDTDGAPGNFQTVLSVYNREKKACIRKGCRGIIMRKKIKQRSSYWCASCQK